MSGIDKIKIGLTGIAGNALSDLINSKPVTTDTTSKEESTISKIEVDNIDVSKTIQETSIARDKTSYTSEEIDAMVKNYKGELQDQLNEYDELLNYVEQELKPLDDVKAQLNEFYVYYEEFANQTKGDVTEIALTYKNVYCSEEKLKELGLTYEELQNLELNKLIEICKEKDPDIIEKYKAIESYKTEILDKKVAEETEFKTYEEYKEYRDALESDQVILKSAIRKIKQEIECAEYNFLTLSEEYQNYSYDATKEVSPLEELRASKESFFGGLKFMNNKKELENLLIASERNPELSKMYNYLYEKEGLESATEYLTKMEDTINQEVGKKQAEAFLMKLEEEKNAADVITNHLKVTGKGLVDGTESFAGGVAAWFTGSEVYTVDEYESMYIIQALQNEEKYDFLLDNNYEISQSIGNMLPSIAISIVLTPAAGATVGSTAATVSMGVSAGGNSYHSALVEGQDPSKAVVYGVLSGVSEATLERMLGGIPGLSDVNVTGLKTFAQAMLQEGIEEGSQEYIDALMRAGLFGEEIDIEEVTKNAGKSAIYGAITAGIMNTPSLTINSINSVNSKNDINVTEKITDIDSDVDIEITNERNSKMAKLKTEIENFNLEKFLTGKTENDGAILLITPNQTIMTECFEETGQHAHTVEEMYKVIYETEEVDFDNRSEDIWQHKVTNDGNIVIQLCHGCSSVVWVPETISQSQYNALNDFYNKTLEISNQPGAETEFLSEVAGVELESGNIEALENTLKEAQKRIGEIKVKTETIVGLTNELFSSQVDATEKLTDITEKIEDKEVSSVELWNGKDMPLSSDPVARSAQEKILAGAGIDSLTIFESIKFGRDHVYTNIEGYELKPDHAYRVVSKELYEQYVKDGIITRNVEEYVMGENNGGVDWYLGGAALKYGDKSNDVVILECPADKNFFVPRYSDGGSMADHPYVKHMKSSSKENPIPMSMITNVIEVDVSKYDLNNRSHILSNNTINTIEELQVTSVNEKINMDTTGK